MPFSARKTRELIESSGRPATEIAEAAGVTQSTIYRLTRLSGTDVPNVTTEMLDRLALALSVSPGAFLEDPRPVAKSRRTTTYLTRRRRAW